MNALNASSLQDNPGTATCAGPNERGAFGVDDCCRYLGIGRTTFYLEVESGNLALRKVGRKSIVTRAEADRWLNALPLAKPSRGAA
jgi:excisionase family DNA binding protein